MASLAIGRPRDSGLTTHANALALLSLLAVAMVFSVGTDGRLEPEFWWHLLYGKATLNEWRIPTSDWMSWTFEGAPYKTTQWLGQVVLWIAWSTLGPAGTAAVTVACSVGVSLVATRFLLREIPSPLPATCFGVLLTSQFWGLAARPQVLAFLAMAVLVMLLDRERRTPGARWSALAMLTVGCVWANAHGSFVIGLTWCAVLGVIVCWARSREEGGLSWPTCVRWGWLAVCYAAGTIANPVGIGAWRYTMEVAGLLTTRIGIIREWNPTSIATLEGGGLLLLAVVTFGAMAIRQDKAKTEAVLMVVAAAVMGLLANRIAWFAAIAMLPVAAESLGRVAAIRRLASGWQLPFRTGLGLAAAGAVLSCAANYWQWERKTMSLARAEFPVGAAEFLDEHVAQGRLFNDGGDGGWWYFHTGRRVGLDTRLDMYGDEHVLRWVLTRQGAPLWRSTIAEFDPEIFVIKRTDALASLLVEARLATPVYADRWYTVLLKSSEPRFAGVIAQFGRPLPVVDVLGERGTLQLPVRSW